MCLGDWNLNERETLKKYLLIFGYGRWRKIRTATATSDHILEDKNDNQFQIYSISFMKALCALLPNEAKELKAFLQNLIEQGNDEVAIESNVQMWGGEVIIQRAHQWAKRIHLLKVVQQFTKAYKQSKQAYLSKDPAQIDSKVKRMYLNNDNLLNFIPNEQLQGMRPCPWWTRRNDIDLILGTHKYGYGSYSQMREDPNISFANCNKTDQHQIFPLAELVTRRLKKLTYLISRYEANEGKYDFELLDKNKEPTGLTLNHKNAIVKVLIDYGVAVDQHDHNKHDMQTLRLKVNQLLDSQMEVTDKVIDRFI